MDLMSDPSPAVCEPAISPDFVAAVTVFRIIVLTYNRPRHLATLLRSLQDRA